MIHHHKIPSLSFALALSLSSVDIIPFYLCWMDTTSTIATWKSNFSPFNSHSTRLLSALTMSLEVNFFKFDLVPSPLKQFKGIAKKICLDLIFLGQFFFLGQNQMQKSLDKVIKRVLSYVSLPYYSHLSCEQYEDVKLYVFDLYCLQFYMFFGSPLASICQTALLLELHFRLFFSLSFFQFTALSLTRFP